MEGQPHFLRLKERLPDPYSFLPDGFKMIAARSPASRISRHWEDSQTDRYREIVAAVGATGTNFQFFLNLPLSSHLLKFGLSLAGCSWWSVASGNR